jgi:hypothetical protein
VEHGTAADAPKGAATLAATVQVEMDALKDESEAKYNLEEGSAESKELNVPSFPPPEVFLSSPLKLCS